MCFSFDSVLSESLYFLCFFDELNWVYDLRTDPSAFVCSFWSPSPSINPSNSSPWSCWLQSSVNISDPIIWRTSVYIQTNITESPNREVQLYVSLFSAQAPKSVKIFINLPRSMGFDDAERSEATQALDLSEEDYKDDGLIPLRYVKFQNVNSVTVRHSWHWQRSHYKITSQERIHRNKQINQSSECNLEMLCISEIQKQHFDGRKYIK